MIDERELISRAVDVQAPPEPSFERLLSRRDRKRRNQRIRAGVLGLAIAIAVGWLGVNAIRSTSPVPADDRSVDLGIFEPFAGRIVYHTNSDLWAVDPNAPSPSTLEHLGLAEAERFASLTVPLGWSTDGTELLFVREDPADQTFPYDRRLYILHADGTETQVVPEPVSAAAMSPDGSRVVYATDSSDGLYAVDAKGGQPVQITAFGEEPTFSPDGTQIAYLSSPRSGGQVLSGREHVWVANADGTAEHEILADEPALAKGVFELEWSPAGDRIAMENTLEGRVAIYTFAPDGSDFTKVIDGGMNPYWSPDGSQIAYVLPGGSPGLSIADADGSNVRTFAFGDSGPWHPGVAADEPKPSPAPSESVPPSGSEAEQIIAEGTLTSFAATGSGTVLTVWETCEDFDDTDCGHAWRLGRDSETLATGMVGHGDVHVDVNTTPGGGFVLTPADHHRRGFVIAQDGTASPLSWDCRDTTWSTPTEPGRLHWASGLSFVDTVTGVICPTSRLGGRPLARGVFTDDGTLWALVDNETGPETLTIGRYDGARWHYRDLDPKGMSWESELAAAASNVVVVHARTRVIGLSVSTDAGATWHEVTDPNVLERDLPFSTYALPEGDSWFSDYSSMAFAGSSVLYVADGRGDLWRSTDLTTFSQVDVAGGVSDLKPTGDAVIARLDDGKGLVRISADGSVEHLAAR